jgi:hypothetical protein
MPEHSAEFYRGVVFGMHAAGIDCIAREELVDNYRALLAQAESREASPEAAALERDAATSHAAELRAALEEGKRHRWYHRKGVTSSSLDIKADWIMNAEAILERTPAQSLVAVQARALRELIAEADKRRASIVLAFGDVSAGDILGLALEMAERLEKQ